MSRKFRERETLTALTDGHAEKPRLAFTSDQQQIDRQPSGNDRQWNEALGGIVEQRQQNEKQHDQKENDRQQDVYL